MQYRLTYGEQNIIFNVNDKEQETVLYLGHDSFRMEGKQSQFGYGFGAGVFLCVLFALAVAFVTSVVT